MKPDRHHARVLAMQALCQLEVQGDDLLGNAEILIRDTDDEAAPNLLTTHYARVLATAAWENRAESAKRIKAAGPRWDVERMGAVERNVIRTAIAEWEKQGVPPKVVLNEAIEIAREYASAESAGFVNGVLDQLHGNKGLADKGTE